MRDSKQQEDFKIFLSDSPNNHLINGEKRGRRITNTNAKNQISKHLHSLNITRQAGSCITIKICRSINKSLKSTLRV